MKTTDFTDRDEGEGHPISKVRPTATPNVGAMNHEIRVAAARPGAG
jgi:hypothetical protein